MAHSPDLRRQQEEREEEEEEEVGAQREGGPTHHPTAPPDELFDVSTTVDPSYVISLIRKLLPDVDSHNVDGDGEVSLPNDGLENMDTHIDDFEDSKRVDGNGQTNSSEREKAWEECGTVLWDLAASQSHAELMVENLILDVLLANLLTSDSVRITEICLGIIGNLACHENLMKKIVSTRGLVEVIVDQVLSDDPLCLCEVCRLLTLGLQSSERITWANALLSDHVLSRILWVAENTLNPVLIEKSVGLLLSILENQEEVAPLLLPRLVNFGLPNLLVNLLTFEMGKLRGDREPERYSALDSVLRAVEALSVVDDYSQEICSNKEILQMATELVKLPDKIEIAHCCVTAAVLVANILTDAAELATEMAKDLDFLQCLFDLFPFTSDDVEARDALWSIASRLLVRVPDTEMSASSLSSYVLLLVDKTDIIEDDLLDYPFDPKSHGQNNSSVTAAKRMCRKTTNLFSSTREPQLKKIVSILNRWIQSKGQTESDNFMTESQIDDGAVQRLIECCLKHTDFDLRTESFLETRRELAVTRELDLAFRMVDNRC